MLSPRAKKMLGKLQVYLVAVIIIIYFVIPHIWLIQAAFNPKPKPRISAFMPTFMHFQRVMKAHCLEYFQNGLIMSILTMVISVAVSSLAGYGLAKLDFPGKDLLILILLVSTAVPVIGYIVPYYKMMIVLNLVNTYWGCVLLFVTGTIPANIWIMKSFFETIPKEIEEAAIIDGCDRLRLFTRITFPLTLPGLILTSLTSFGAGWGDFLAPMILLTKRELYPLSVGMIYESQTPHGFYDLGLFSAFSLIYAAPLVILYVVLRRYLLKGMVAGAIKG